jgi:hypothetical protein
VRAPRRASPSEKEEDDQADEEPTDNASDQDNYAGARLEETTRGRRQRRVSGDEEMKDRDLGDAQSDQDADRRVVAVLLAAELVPRALLSTRASRLTTVWPSNATIQLQALT